MRIKLYSLYKYTELLKRKVRRTTTLSGRWLLIMTLVALVFGLNTQATMLYQLAAFLLVVLLISFPLSFRFSPQTTGTRNIPATCTVGEKLTYTLRLVNKGAKKERGLLFREHAPDTLPTFAEFDKTPESGEEKRNFVDRSLKYYRWLWLIKRKVGAAFPLISLEEIPPGEEREMEVSFTAQKRGYLHLDGYSLVRAEPLGLFKKEILTRLEKNILVLPRTYPVSDIHFDGSRKYHQGGISSAAKYGDSQEFIALREYQAGDSIRHIDWKATARLQKPILRQYQDEYFSRFGIILDTFTSLDYCPIFEEAVSVAASIVIHEDPGSSVIDLLFAGSTFVSTTTMGKGLAEQNHMLEILASVSTCRDKQFTELTDLVKSHTELLSGAVLIFIDLDSKRKKMISYLQALNIPFKAVLISSDGEESRKKVEQHDMLPFITIIDINRATKEIRLS